MKSGRIGSNQVRGWRRVQQVALTADNQTFQVDLPRGPAIEESMIIVDGTINVSVAFTTVRGLAPSHYLRRVDWRLNGNITLDALSGVGAYLASGITSRNIDGLTAPASAGTGAKTIRGIWRLPRIFQDMFRPKDSVLKTDENVTTNQLVIQWGQLADFFTGAGTATYTALTMYVMIRDYQEEADNKGFTPRPLYYWKRSEQILAFAATGNNQPFRVNTGNRLRLLLCRFETAGEGADNIITGARILRSGDTRMDLPQPVWQEESRLSGFNFIGAMSGFPGIYVADFGNPGMMGARYSECWPVPSNADVQMLFDVATASTAVRIVTIEGVDLQQ